MDKFIILLNLISIFSLTSLQANEKTGYGTYHQQVIEAETLIACGKFSDALQVYEILFKNYDFIFVREYQIATQLALFLNETKKAEKYLRKGILSGWQMKSVKRNEYLDKLRETRDWKSINNQYENLNKQYQSSINEELRNRVKKMFSKDQRKAMGALLTFSSKAQDRYAEKRFAPHSEIQMAHLIEIIENQGYPGEKLIGNNFWMSTIIAHHNSISEDYNRNDTIYLFIKPLLIQAIERGQISPYEFALIDDWKKAVVSKHTEIGYGFLNPPNQLTLSETNCLRQNIGLRTVELRNKLVDVEKRTGMNFYLPDWIKGKIKVEQK